MSSKRLDLRREDGIFYLELIAPPANQTDRLFFQELTDIIPTLCNTHTIRGLIIYGRGNHFSSGADIDELKAEMTKNNVRIAEELMSRSVDLFNKLAELPYPVVAAIRGCCLGSGLELALSCNYRISTKNGLFSLPETTFALMPGCGGTVRLPRLVGRAKSIELILSGCSFLAEDGFKMGLIDCIVDKKELLEAAKKLIHTVHSLHAPLKNTTDAGKRQVSTL